MRLQCGSAAWADQAVTAELFTCLRRCNNAETVTTPLKTLAQKGLITTGITNADKSMSIMITSLTNQVFYNCSVTAKNTYGYSTNSTCTPSRAMPE